MVVENTKEVVVCLGSLLLRLEEQERQQLRQVVGLFSSLLSLLITHPFNSSNHRRLVVKHSSFQLLDLELLASPRVRAEATDLPI